MKHSRVIIKDTSDRKPYKADSLETGMFVLLKIFGFDLDGEKGKKVVKEIIEEVKKDGRASVNPSTES
jgi:hypothetical protein